MVAEPLTRTHHPAPRPRTAAWVLLALAVMWLVAVPLGLGQALIGPPPGGDVDAHATSIALLYLPGLLAFSLGAYLASSHLTAALPRWRPGQPVPGLLRRSERLAPPPESPPALAISAPVPATTSPHRTHSPSRSNNPSPNAQPATAPPLLALGPGHSPAYAAFGLAYRSSIAGPAASGFIALPPAGRLVLGRDPAADVVVGLAEVSWHHLELEVTESGVTVTDLGSTNGTRTLTPDNPETPTSLAPKMPQPWPVGATLHLAEPVALTLTLEALR